MGGRQGFDGGGEFHFVEDVFLERRYRQDARGEGVKVQFRAGSDARRRDAGLGHLERHPGRRVEQDRLETV